MSAAWQVDRDPLPLGPPSLMMSLTGPEQVHSGEMEAKDQATGSDSAKLAQARAQLTYNRKPAGVDDWEHSGKGIAFGPTPVDVM